MPAGLAKIARFAIPRFSLRTLLIAITLLAPLLGWLGNRILAVRQQRQVIAALHGSHIYFDYQVAGTALPGPAIVRWAFGNDVFARVVGVHTSFASPPITDNQVQLLLKLPALKTVALHGPGITDQSIATLVQMRELRELAFYDTAVTPKGLARLKELSGLKHLTLKSATSSDAHLAAAAEIPSIEHLQIARSTATAEGMKSIGRMRQLRTLDLLDVPGLDDEGLAHLEDLRNLEALEIVYRPNAANPVTDRGLESLRSFRRLTSLQIWNAPITDSAGEHLQHLRSLQRLDLMGTQFGDEGCQRIADLQELQRLDLSHAAITDAALPHLAQLTKLEALDLDRTSTTDEGLPHLAALTGLQRLSVGNNVTLAGAEQLKQRLPNCIIEKSSAAGSPEFRLP